MTSRTRILALSALAAGTLVLAACGGGGSSSDSSSAAPAPSDSAIGGGSAECTEPIMEQNAEGSAQAAGVELVDTKSYECADGWAIVFAITKSNDIEQTTAFVYQAEGPVWAQKQLDSLCSGNADGAPQTIVDQACALR
jgi:hypothetical protein